MRTAQPAFAVSQRAKSARTFERERAERALKEASQYWDASRVVAHVCATNVIFTERGERVAAIYFD